MSIERVLESNVQEVNQMYYEQVKRVAVLNSQVSRYREVVEELLKSVTYSEPVTQQRVREICEEFKIAL